MSSYALICHIFITNSCNRDCEGCYTNLQADTSLKMSMETADDVARWIVNWVNEEQAERLSMPILGGEPLTNPDVLFHLVDTLKRDLPKHLRSIRGVSEERLNVLFTNGDFLTDDILRKLGERKMILFINPTDDSLSNVENKIRKVKEACGGCSMSITLTKQNMERLTNLVELALKYGCLTRICRLYGGGKDPNYIKEYGKQMHKVFDLLLAAPVPMPPNWIVESTWVTWDKASNPNGCGKWSIHIGPDGSIRSCNSDMDTIMGSIYTHSKLSDFKFPHRWSAKNLPECQGCEFITFCQGGCPYSRKLTYGTYDKRTPFCKELKTIYPRLLELRDKWQAYMIQSNFPKFDKIQKEQMEIDEHMEKGSVLEEF